VRGKEERGEGRERRRGEIREKGRPHAPVLEAK